MTLRKLPEFGSLYDEDEDEDEGYGTTGAGGSKPKPKFDEMVKLQGQVVYALLQGILEAFKVTRETDDSDSYLLFRSVASPWHVIPGACTHSGHRARLLNCQLEYWIGYSERYKDGPLTAGLACLDHHPDKRACPTVLPVSAVSFTQDPYGACALTSCFRWLTACSRWKTHFSDRPSRTSSSSCLASSF